MKLGKKSATLSWKKLIENLYTMKYILKLIMEKSKQIFTIKKISKEGCQCICLISNIDWFSLQKWQLLLLSSVFRRK